MILPIDPGVELDVREHAMIVATAALTYSFEKLPGLKATLAVGSGMYLDAFPADDGPGLLLLHGYGNVLSGRSAEERPSRWSQGASCTRTPRSRWRR